MKDANDLTELRVPKLNFLKDSFYSDTNIMIDNNDLLDNEIDIKLFKLIHTATLSNIVDELKILSDNGKMHSDNLLDLMNTVINAILEQSSENKDFLNKVKDDISSMIYDINNNNHLDFNSFPNLIDRIDSKLIYLNGHYTYIKKVTINDEDDYLSFNFPGTNKFSLINGIEKLLSEYNSLGNSINEIQKHERLTIFNLLNELKCDFYDKYGILYSKSDYINILDKDLNDNDIFKNYILGNDNLIFHNKLDVFRLKYNFNNKTNQALIQCDSLFKLRY